MIRKDIKLSPDELSELLADETMPSLEDTVLGNLDKNKILCFVNTLPKLQKDVMTLYSTFGLSFSEIAEKLCISETAVRQRLCLGRKALRKFVESRLTINE